MYWMAIWDLVSLVRPFTRSLPHEADGKGLACQTTVCRIDQYECQAEFYDIAPPPPVNKGDQRTV